MIVVLRDSHACAFTKSLRGSSGESIRSSLAEKFGPAAALMIRTGAAFHSRFFNVEGQSIYLKTRVPERFANIVGNDGAIRPDDGNVYGFSFGFHSAVMLRQDYWKDYTILPDIAGKAYISRGVFRHMVLAENAHILEFARAIKELGMRFFFVCAPPIRQAMLDGQADIASPEELIAIKQTYQRIMMAAFDDIGASYIVPPESTTENAILKDKYDSRTEGDVHHANRRYGKVMWREILEQVDAPERALTLSEAV